MALENLFATEPELPSIQKQKMPENPEKWAEVLTTMVREQFPDLALLPLTVDFRKRDDQSGTAIGAVHVVSIEAQRSAYIPFIIEKFQLHPLDIWMESKTQAVHPLKKDTFKELFFVQNLADGLDARPADSSGTYFNDPSLWNTNYPPLQGRYSYASAGYTLLDQISDTMSEDDLVAFRKEVKENPTLLMKFAKKGHEEIIKKLAAKKSTVHTNNLRASAAKLIPSAVDVKREGYDKYSIISSTEGIYDLASTAYLDRSSCEKFLANITANPQDFINEVDQNGEKMVILKPAPTEGVWLYDNTAKAPEDATEFTCYWVKNKNGLLIDALVIPKVVNFEGKVQSGKMVLSRTHSCYQKSVAGVKYPESACMLDVLKPQGARVGQTGCFVYAKDGKAIATLPVTIKAIEGTAEYTDCLHVVDLNGKAMRISQGYGSAFENRKKPKGEVPHPQYANETTATLESLGFAELGNEKYVIPSGFVWIPMQPMTDVVTTPSEWLEKTAAHKMVQNPVEIRYIGPEYHICGGGLPKLSLSERETKLLLANLGAHEKTAEILKRAKRVGKASVHGCCALKSKAEAEKKPAELIAKIGAACKALKKNLIKEAAEVDHQATVDVMLALNFLNPENLAKFVSYKPVLDRAADLLAELTLASRLGLKDISSAATVGAMHRLVEVSDGLAKLQSSMKKPSTKVG